MIHAQNYLIVGCPDSVYFHMLFLIMYLSAIERLICCGEIFEFNPYPNDKF